MSGIPNVNPYVSFDVDLKVLCPDVFGFPDTTAYANYIKSITQQDSNTAYLIFSSASVGEKYLNLSYARRTILFPNKDKNGNNIREIFEQSCNERYKGLVGPASAEQKRQLAGQVFKIEFNNLPDVVIYGLHSFNNYLEADYGAIDDNGTTTLDYPSRFGITFNNYNLGNTQVIADTSQAETTKIGTKYDGKEIRNVKVTFTTTETPKSLSFMFSAGGGGGGGVEKYEDLTDVNVVGRVDGSATHFNSVSGLYEPANEVKVDPTTRDISMTTTGAFGVVATGNAGVQSTGADAVVAGLNARLSAPLGNAEVNGSVTDILADNNLSVISNLSDVTITASNGNVDVDAPNGQALIDAATIQATGASGPVALFANGPNGDVIGNASRFIVMTGAQGANLTATTSDTQVAAIAGTTFIYGLTKVDVDGNDIEIDATTGDVDINAPNGAVDVDSSSIQMDSVGAFTMGSGGVFGVTAAGAVALTSTGGSAGLTSNTSVASIKGNSVNMTNNALRFVEIDATSKCNSNADGFQLNSIGAANNFNVTSQGGANITSTADMAIQSNTGKLTAGGATEVEINAPLVDINSSGVITIDAGSDILVNAPTGDVDITSGQNAFINSTAGTFISGFTGVSASANNGDVILSSAKFNGKAQLRATNNLGGQVEISSAGTGAGNNIIFYKNTDTSATPSLTIAPGVGGGAAYDIFTNVAYTAPGPNSLINRSQLDAKLPDGVQGAAVPQDPFGQALVWNGTQWKAGSAIQGAPNEITTLIANGTGDVVLTATGTGNIGINTTDNTTSVDIQSGGIVVPVGGATEPTAKANNNLYQNIAGVAGTSLAILTKDFLNKLYIARSYVEFDSHGNVSTTAMNVLNQFEPFANPNPVYSKTEDPAGEWSVLTTPASGFTFTRAGATNVLFQYSFSVTIVGDNTGINNDKFTFALYIDSGAGFVQVPTSVFSATIAGNTDASIVSATGLARINSGWILQPRVTNTTAVRDVRIEDFKLSITECPTGVA